MIACNTSAVAVSRRRSGRGIVPGGVFALQDEERSNGVAPTLQAGAPVGRPPIADDRRCLVGFAARAIAGLAFGVAERLRALGLSASWHGSIAVT
jgi:hypothetical protein